LGTSLLAKGGKIFLILIPQYVGTFLCRVIITTQNSKIIPYNKLGTKLTNLRTNVRRKVPALFKKDKYKSAAQPILVIQIFLQS
jgi:hypothetical protein